MRAQAAQGPTSATDADQWAAFEVKLSPASVEAGAASLLKFAAGIDTV